MAGKISRKFLLSDRKDKNGEYPVIYRILAKRSKTDLSTGASCSNESWDSQTERIRNKPKLNRLISEVEEKVEKIIKKLEVEEKTITVDLIKALLKGNELSKKSLLSYAKYFNEKYVLNNREIGESARSHYKTCFDIHVKNYLTYKNNLKGTDKSDRISSDTYVNKEGNPDILLINCNLDYINDFDYYLINISKKHRNTANNQHKKLSKLFKQAIIQKEINQDPYNGFKKKNKRTIIHKLEREQLDIIETHDLGGNKSLQEVRDCFVFSCYTGLRISHALSLRKEHIILKEGKYWMNTSAEQSKTEEPLLLPMLNKAVEIIKKYKELQDITGFILPRRAKPKINSYLKVIADLTGIDVGEPLHFHHSRHTFGTLICAENEIPLEATMKFMSHSDIRSTMIYAEIRKGMLIKYANKMDKNNAKNEKRRNKKIS